MPDRKNFIVTLSGDRAVADVQSDLSNAGFAVKDVHGEIGVLTGSFGDADESAIRAVTGIADISEDKPIDIGPPGSGESW